MALAAVRDLRAERPQPGPEDVADFETDVLAGFVLARASAGLADTTIRGDVGHLEQVRIWFGRPLWDMEPADADAYFGRVLRETAKGTRLARAQALKTYFLFLELRHKAEIHNLTGRVLERPIDELNRPRGAGEARAWATKRGQRSAADTSGRLTQPAALRRSAGVTPRLRGNVAAVRNRRTTTPVGAGQREVPPSTRTG